MAIPHPALRELFEHFCRHFVAVHVRCSIEERVQHYVYSGFILAVDGRWFIALAGHSLENLKEALRQSNRTDSLVELLDSSGDSAKFRHPIPYSKDLISNAASVHQEGFDYGLLPLPDLLIRNLRANGIEPLDEAAWDGVADQNAKYWLLGIPEETVNVSENSDGSARLETRPHLMHIEKLPSCPPDIENSRGRTFFGRVQLGEEQTSIVGASGGPIFAVWFQSEKEFTYGVVALQSCWVERSRHITGCDIRSFALRIKEIFNAHKEAV